jgi:hypothetical protein
MQASFIPAHQLRPCYRGEAVLPRQGHSFVPTKCLHTALGTKTRLGPTLRQRRDNVGVAELEPEVDVQSTRCGSRSEGRSCGEYEFSGSTYSVGQYLVQLHSDDLADPINRAPPTSSRYIHHAIDKPTPTQHDPIHSFTARSTKSLRIRKPHHIRKDQHIHIRTETPLKLAHRYKHCWDEQAHLYSSPPRDPTAVATSRYSAVTANEHGVPSSHVRSFITCISARQISLSFMFVYPSFFLQYPSNTTTYILTPAPNPGV